MLYVNKSMRDKALQNAAKAKIMECIFFVPYFWP